MNLIDGTVTKVLSKPEFKFNKWFVEVEYESYGVKSTTKVMFDTEYTASCVDVGYVFLT